MREVVPFRRWHMAWLHAEGEAVGGMLVDPGTLQVLEKLNSWTAVVDDAPVACGGTMLQWPGRHIAWAYLNQKTAPHMLWLTREAKKKLQRVDGRIEMTVRHDFEQGHRWASILGFKIETPVLQAYGPLGENHVGYVRLNGG